MLRAVGVSAVAPLVDVAGDDELDGVLVLLQVWMQAVVGELGGKVALYGLYFDTDKDAVRSESEPTMAEIAKLMKEDASLRLHVVGHTDNQGEPDYNLELSRRRAASVVAQLTSKYGIGANRLDAFGCGLYAPVASNEAESGRGKNRRVELVGW